MSTGMIAAKYASALLKFVDETGGGEALFAQVRKLDSALDSSGELRRIVDDPVGVTGQDKIKACEIVLGETMVDELSKFLGLVISHRRLHYLRLMLKSFIERYLKSRNIHIVDLTTAVPSEELEQKISALVRKNTGGEVILNARVDPDIIGGFVFRCEDLLLDASISSQLDAIRHQFIERNRRIV